jgi:ABC-type multidrug transport system ATPase subunit
MTTHAMEEAELLSDKLIVLNHGQIKCTGTPLQLKNMLGKGYRIGMIADKKNVGQVRVLMR